MIKKIPQWQSLGHLLRERAEKIGKIFAELAESQIIPAELFFPVIKMLNGFP